MKKILLSIIIAAACCFAASSQTLSNRTRIIGLNYGFGGLEKSSVGLSYERILADGLFGVNSLSLGIGTNINYYGYSEKTEVAGLKYTYDHDNYIYTLRGAFHFEPVNGLDLYLGANGGGTSLTEKHRLVTDEVSMKAESESDFKFVWGAVAGVRYFISNTFGIGVEGCYGNALNNVSVSLSIAF